MLLRILLLVFAVALFAPRPGLASFDVVELAEVTPEVIGEEDEVSRATPDGIELAHRYEHAALGFDELSPPTRFETQLFRPPRSAFV